MSSKRYSKTAWPPHSVVSSIQESGFQEPQGKPSPTIESKPKCRGQRRCLTAVFMVIAFAGVMVVPAVEGLAQIQEPLPDFDNIPAGWDNNPRGDDFEDLPPAVKVAIMIVAVLFLLGMLAITVFIIYLLYKLLDALPPEYRLMEPPLVWMLLIPCFNLIWNFFVYVRISKSYQHYFHTHGRMEVGDCGAGIGIAYAICTLLTSIPCLNYFTAVICGPAALILMIIYLVQLYGLKKQIPLVGKQPLTPRFQPPHSGANPFSD